jgi:hypothetical protein
MIAALVRVREPGARRAWSKSQKSGKPVLAAKR